MKDRESIIIKYFSAWLCNDSSGLEEIFDQDIIYSECYGPEYQGLNQIIQWFSDWNNHGQVLVWDIKQFIHQENVTVVEWHFECDYKGKVSGFDGVSIVEFNNNKIMNLKEFQSDAKHIYPYGIKR